MSWQRQAPCSAAGHPPSGSLVAAPGRQAWEAGVAAAGRCTAGTVGRSDTADIVGTADTAGSTLRNTCGERSGEKSHVRSWMS